MIRHIIELLSRGIVLRRRLPAEFERRSVFVSPEGGGLRYFKWNMDTIDPMLLHTVRKFIKPGNTIWDIGGNLGFFAFPSVIQSKGGKVAVFEPDIYLAGLLRRSADANPDLEVDIFPLAVSDTNGMARFNIAIRSRSTNFLDQSVGSTQTGGVRRTITVPTVTLDSVLSWYPKPDFIKIDTEGAEVLVLKGMQKILSEIRPVILCEVSKMNSPELVEILIQHNYQLYGGEALPELVPYSAIFENVIAIPN